MESNTDKRRLATSGWSPLVIIFAVALLYLLSSGPAFRWLGERGTSDETLEAIYAPIIWLCDRNEFADRVMYKYGSGGYARWKLSREVRRLTKNSEDLKSVQS